MSVRKLFWDDPYRSCCDAVVTAVDGDVVTLDQTVAFAFSGGQASDRGTIGGFEILRAECRGFEIAYTLAPHADLAVGDPVVVAIDWPHRYRVMRLHFAAELALEVITQRFGAPEKVGANITAAKARLDFRWEGSIASTFPILSAEVARLVADDLPIASDYADVASQRRYWEIPGFARVPCGGTHPRRTSEVGAIALRRDNRAGGVERIEIRLDE